MGDIEHEQKNCFYSWMSLQAKNMLDLKHALIIHHDHDHDHDHGYGHCNCNDPNLTELTQKVIRDFEDYMGKRYELGRRCSSNYFAPSWNTPLENALIWIAGCRPSSFIRLIYTLCGAETEIFLSKFLDLSPSPTVADVTEVGGCSIGELTSTQFRKINDLHIETVSEEDKLTTRVATLQEDTSDMPAALVAYYKEPIGEANVAVDRALDKQEAALAEIVSEADKLRLSTLKKIMEILTTVQAADFLVAAKKLHLCMHEWGKTRDRRRNNACAFAGGEEESN